MSEVKKPSTKKSEPSKTDTPREDAEPKEKKAGPKAKKDDTKKDIPKVDEGSKEAKDIKNKKGDIKKDPEEINKKNDTAPKEGSAEVGDQKGKPIEEKTKEEKPKSLLSSEVDSLQKSITDEFGQIASFFTKSLQKAIKSVSDTPETIKMLQKNHMNDRSMEGICKAAQHCAKETFTRVSSTFEEVNRQLKKQGIKEAESSTAKDAEELTVLIAKIDREFKTVFEEKCKLELAESMKGFETVTMKGLDTDAEQRLLSANYALKSAEKNKAGLAGAVDGSKVKRTVVAGVFDKVFVGYKDLSVSMAIRRELNSDKSDEFKFYQQYFSLKPCPDMVLKGMGNFP